MSNTIFLPYEFKEDSITLKAVGIEKDGEQLDLATYSRGESLNLPSLRDWVEIKIHLQVCDLHEAVEGTLQEGETLSSNVDLQVLVHGQKGRSRGSAKVIQDGAVGTCSILIRRADHIGTLKLQAFATRSQDGADGSVRASRKGERLASSPMLRVYLDDSAPMPGGSIDGEWHDFTEEKIPDLRKYKDCAWHLDLTDEERPKLYMNQAVPGLRNTLEASPKTGKIARVRNALLAAVLQPVLLAMAYEALASAGESKSIDDIDGWQKTLLLHLAGECEDGTREVVVERWLEGWPLGARSIVTRDLTASIQRHLGLGDAAKFLISEVGETDD